MDISVSRLNNRLALQLPAELPLGLIFVVGIIDNLVESDPESVQDHKSLRFPQFDLIEGTYRLQCRLTPRATPDSDLHPGDRVRVGGHLVFDSHQAGYFLVARDVEVVTEPASPVIATRIEDEKRAALKSALANVKKRAEAARLAPAELPVWVQKIAPPEVQETPAIEAGADLLEESAVAEEPLTNELVEFAASAMESEEEIELRPEIIQKLAPAAVSPHAPRVESPGSSEAAARTDADQESSLSPAYAALQQRHETDWLVILLIFSFVILTIAIIVASILLLLR